MITIPEENLKVGQRFRSEYVGNSTCIFINDDVIFFIEDELEENNFGLEDIEKFLSDKISPIELFNFREMLELQNIKLFSYVNTDRDDTVQILCVKNNKLNKKLYPNNEISKCKKYINL